MADCYYEMSVETPNDAAARAFSPECDICNGAPVDKHVIACPSCNTMQHVECLVDRWTAGTTHVFACSACSESFADQLRAMILDALTADAGAFGVEGLVRGRALRKKL